MYACTDNNDVANLIFSRRRNTELHAKIHSAHRKEDCTAMKM
jgi:hypothetical protein